MLFRSEINVDEDEEREVGIVNISSSDQDKIDAAKQRISDMMRVIEVGDEFDGTVTRVEGYGAFVEFLPGREGLVHISEMSTDRVENVEDVAKLGDTVHVRVNEIKDDGKIGLSMLSAEEGEQKKSRQGGDRRGGDRGGRSRGRFNDRRGGGRGNSRGRRDGFRMRRDD